MSKVYRTVSRFIVKLKGVVTSTVCLMFYNFSLYPKFALTWPADAKKCSVWQLVPRALHCSGGWVPDLLEKLALASFTIKYSQRI